MGKYLPVPDQSRGIEKEMGGKNAQYGENEFNNSEDERKKNLCVKG